MKFKGQTVRGPTRQYFLKDQLGQGGFSVLFNTVEQQTICKVQVLSNPQIYKAYKSEKQTLQQLQHKNIVQLKESFQLKDKEGYFGFLLMQNCNSGTAWNVLDSYGQNDVPQKLVLKIAYYVASALQYMHKKGITHRDIKLQNVLINSKGEYKLCDFGSSSKETIKTVSKQSREDIQQYIEKTTTPLYRSPQQLDLYSGYEIGSKVDVFALGVLMFMLCFKKPAFQSRLSAINKQYFVPQQTSYSSELISLIDKCFTVNPKDRITATEAKREIRMLMERKVGQLEMNLPKELDATLSEILKINNQMLKKSTVLAQSSLFDKLKLIYNQMTTQTEGWIASFVQDNQQAPQLKYNRSIISKCWQKRYKVEKIYQILFKYSQDYKTKSLVNLKLLILMHNFLRKGPPQCISYQGKFSPAKVATKVYKNWKLYQRATDPDDIKRNSYVCLLIRYYSLILTAKWKLCYQNSDLIEGNFSILPFFQSKKEIALLKLPFICDLIEFLNMCAEFHQILSTRSYLVDIQRSIILSLVDEEYCCVSLLVFLLCSFKQAVCHLSQELDLDKLAQKLKYVEKDFENVFNKLSKLFESVNKMASLFQEDTSFSLSPKILEKIKRINIREKKSGSFQFSKHINYERSIEGLKIPVSYEEAVKNPNFLKNLEKRDDDNVLEMNQYKIKKNNDVTQTKSQQSTQLQPTTVLNNQQPSNQSFKKNKQHKVFQNQQLSKIISSKNITWSQQSKETKFNAKKQSLNEQSDGVMKSSRLNMMEFTHQNLNKDMNSSIVRRAKGFQGSKVSEVNIQGEGKNSTMQQDNQFKDFLSIVDDKFSKAQLIPSKQQVNSPNQKAKNQKDPKINDIFNTFTNLADDTKSKISSVNSNNNLWGKPNNNIFTHPFQSVNNKINDNKFEAFGTIISNQQQYKRNTPPQVGKSLTSYQSKPQDNTVYSSITSISKDVYNTLNNRQDEEAKKVELMNFFDDDQDEEQNAQKNTSNNNDFLQNQQVNDFFSKTSPEEFIKNKHLLSSSSSKQISLRPQQQSLQEVKFGDSDERMFKSSPGEHSFIDLKGFIVEEVRKNAEQYFIDFSTLKFFGKVGFGHSSQVFKGEWRGRQVAIKRIKDNMSQSNAKEFKRQIMTSVKIRHHPNLVTLIGIAEYQNEYYIINEFCNGATLFDFLHQSGHVISMAVKLSIAKQIAKGMLFLHTNDPPIIHRDLKSLNVLLVNKYNGQPQPQIKIADFGLSRDFASTYMTGTLGTYHWMAPEIFNNEPYSLKADVYSYGIVLWEILSRSPPYTNLKNPQSLMKFITMENGRPDLNLISSDCPQSVKTLMIRCWDKYPQNRPGFKEILQTLNNINL